jgi:hypothetical protein
MGAILDGPDHVELVVLDATLSAKEPVTLATLVRERGIRLVMISGQPSMMKAYNGR